MSWTRAHAEEMTALLAEICAIESPSTDPPAVAALATRLAADVEAYRALMEAEMLAATAVLDFEPAWPGGAVKTSRKGSGAFTLHAHGRASHAGADLARGANAILELARQCLHISKLTDPVRGVSANVGVIRGGLRSNVVPDLAEAEIDVRFLKVDDGHWIERQLRALRPEDPKIQLTWS